MIKKAFKLVAVLFLMQLFISAGFAPNYSNCKGEANAGGEKSHLIKDGKGLKMDEKVAKSDEEWKKVLTAEQFEVARKKGTEPPFSGKYNNFKEKGVFLCVCCGNELFGSETKYDSGSGWPSFMDELSQGAVRLHADNSHGMVRVEVLCGRCDAHLGHVFDDGPPPLGKRFCINSLSLKFDKRD